MFTLHLDIFTKLNSCWMPAVLNIKDCAKIAVSGLMNGQLEAETLHPVTFLFRVKLRNQFICSYQIKWTWPEYTLSTGQLEPVDMSNASVVNVMLRLEICVVSSWDTCWNLDVKLKTLTNYLYFDVTTIN